MHPVSAQAESELKVEASSLSWGSMAPKFEAGLVAPEPLQLQQGAAADLGPTEGDLP